MKTKEKYENYKKLYPNYIVIVKEGIFYKTFYDDAIIIWNMFKYNWNNDSISFGSVVSSKVYEKLKEQGLGYKIIMSDKEIINYEGNKDVYSLYLELSRIVYDKHLKKEELKKKIDILLEQDNNNFDIINKYFEELLNN